MRYWSKIVIFSYSHALDAPIKVWPVGIFPSSLVQKNQNGGLPDDEKSLTICLTIYTEYRRMTDRYGIVGFNVPLDTL